MGVSVCFCVCQGPPGVRGARGEKVNTASPFPFLCLIMLVASHECTELIATPE